MCAEGDTDSHTLLPLLSASSAQRPTATRAFQHASVSARLVIRRL